MGRDYAVGDIHGCFSELAPGLEALGLGSSVHRLFWGTWSTAAGLRAMLEWLNKPSSNAVCGNYDFASRRHWCNDWAKTQPPCELPFPCRRPSIRS